MFMFVFGNAMTQNYNLLRATGEKRTVSLPAEGKAGFFFSSSDSVNMSNAVLETFV